MVRDDHFSPPCNEVGGMIKLVERHNQNGDLSGYDIIHEYIRSEDFGKIGQIDLTGNGIYLFAVEEVSRMAILLGFRDKSEFVDSPVGGVCLEPLEKTDLEKHLELGD
jgi:hypothetical protein